MIDFLSMQALVNLTILETAETILIPGAGNDDILMKLKSRTDSSAVFIMVIFPSDIHSFIKSNSRTVL